MVSQLEIKPVNRFYTLPGLVRCRGSFTYRLIYNLRTPLLYVGLRFIQVWCGVLGFEGIVIRLFHGAMEINVIEILLNGAAFSYMFLKLHQIDKKVDVLEERLDTVIDGVPKRRKK